MVWVPPLLQSFTSPAFGLVGSPEPTPGPDPTDKQLSYLAVRYTCGNESFRLKFDLPGGCSGSGNTPKCTFDTSGTTQGDCSLFTVTPSNGGTIVDVTFTGPGSAGCVFTAGIGKCGNPENPNSGGECVTGVITNGSQTITFSDCGV